MLNIYKEEKNEILEYSDANKFLNFIGQNNVNDNENFFMDASFTLEGLEELYLKNSIFNFNILIYGSYSNEKLDKVILFNVDNLTNRATTLSIKFMSKDINNNFINSSLEFIKENFKSYGFTKIKLSVLRYQIDEKLEKIISYAKFKCEAKLTSQDSKLDRLLYSYKI